MKKEKNRLTSSRRVGMRDINATSIKCHSKLDLESHPILLRNDEILNQVQDDKKWKQDDEGRRGFTLIELLVVILIIGILAAVALPQYQKAVWKSRVAEAYTNLKTLKSALEVCELEHGRITNEYVDGHPCHSMENLGIQIGEVRSCDNCGETDTFIYEIQHNSRFLVGSEEIVGFARSYKDGDLCICIYDDGHFSTNTGEYACGDGKSYADILGLDEDENCTCC